MAQRVEEADVRSIIDHDPDIELEPFITTATILTDKVTARDTDSLLSADDLFEIERHLAAHFYLFHRDFQATSEKNLGASAKYSGRWDLGLDGTNPGQTAKMLDETGFLASLSKGRRPVGVQWLGLAPSDQTDYEDRD